MVTEVPGEIPPSSATPSNKSVESFGQGGEQQSPESFESMMNQPEGYQPDSSNAAKTGEPSPFNLPQQATTAGPPNMDDLAGQLGITAGELSKTEENMKKRPKFNQSQKYLIKKKLGTVQDNARYVAGKMGSEPKPFVSKSQNPVDRFMDMIQDSQDQIGSASKQMQVVGAQGTSNMSPGEMLHIQTKIQKANIELNFVSILVADAASGVKTMFNMQI